MRHVAILIETSRAYGRGLLNGIARYNSEHGHWHTYFQPHGLDEPAPPWMKGWKGDGIIARIDNRNMADAVVKTGLPAVNLRRTIRDLDLPYIGANNVKVGEVGARHLIERGFRQFGFCGYSQGSRHRGETFKRLVEKSGGVCEMIQVPRRQSNWEREQKRIARWLDKLPKPVGIMASNDDLGFQVLDACRRIGAAVPEDIAVLGVDNDAFLCKLSIPALSSININSHETGYQAAALLDRMMKGRKPPKKLPQIDPGEVVIRRSTDVLATSDGDVVSAAQFIRECACNPVTVEDVLNHVALSRSSLEPRFKEVLGHTIHQEIKRVQLARACELLLETDMPIKQIAVQTGFKNVQYLTRVFRNAMNETPAAYRRSRPASP